MPDPDPVPHPPRAEIASRAWVEALAMAGAGPEPAHRAPGELVAAALRAHLGLTRELGRSVPVAALGPDGGVPGLAAFLAVYAARPQRCDDRAGESAPPAERGQDVVEFTAVDGDRLGGDRRRVEHREHGPQGVDPGVARHLEGEGRDVAPHVAQAGA